MPFSYRKKLTTLLVTLFLLISGGQLYAQELPDKPVGHVNDFAGLLSSHEKQKLETKLRNYRDTTTTVIAIATVESLGRLSIEEAATTLFNRWKMWEDDKDNGLLILVSEQDRKMRIEVGYGLEGAIPDIMAGRIIRDIITPRFKRRDYYGGFDRATSAIIQLANGEYTEELAKNNGDNENDIASFIIFILFVIFVIYSSSRQGGGKGNNRRRRRTLGSGGSIFIGGGGSSGGFGGGGFGGFSGGGGFGSGGGGASGGW